MITKKDTILFAEDDLSLGIMVKDCLEDEGYKVVHCKDGQNAIESFEKDKFALCLLDIMMPRKDGYMVAKKIRQQSDRVPILFLTTKGQEEDRLKGYDTGADDYISKPFSMPELLKKIEVFIKRTRKMQSEENVVFHIGQLSFEPANQQLTTPETSFTITQKEASLLQFLCQHQNKLLKREEILLEVWGKDDFFIGRSMDVYMTKLRKYLRADPNITLETIHGVGFRFVVPPESRDALV